MRRRRDRALASGLIAALALTAVASAGCIRVGFDGQESLPPIAFDPMPAKVSTLHAPAMELRGSCTDIDGVIAISGDASAETRCQPGGVWRLTIDLSALPDGTINLFGQQQSADGSAASPPVLRQFLKDTRVCGRATPFVAIPFAGGSGTFEDPFLVCTNEQLLLVGAHLDASVRLENDIDVGATAWSPFGALYGTFDGNGFAIENLRYQASSWPTGLFGEVYGKVAHLSVLGVNIYTYCHVGAIAGILRAGGVVQGCRATGVIQSYADAVGGLVGENTGTIENSWSTVEVTDSGSYHVGGLVGINDPEGVISASAATGRVVGFGSDKIGGLVGLNNGTISNCYARGAAAGNVASTNVGGLVGENTGTVQWSYATGATTGQSVGGLVALSSGLVTSSYWDAATSGLSTSAAGSGLATAAMQSRASFVDWDFATVWRLDVDGAGYPLLAWQVP